MIIRFDKENNVPVMSGPTRLLVRNIPFNKSNAHISPASLGQSHVLRLGIHHYTTAFIPVYETCKLSAKHDILNLVITRRQTTKNISLPAFCVFCKVCLIIIVRWSLDNDASSRGRTPRHCQHSADANNSKISHALTGQSQTHVDVNL